VRRQSFRICEFGSEVVDPEVVDPQFAALAGVSVEVDVLDNPQEGLPWGKAYRCAFVGRGLVDDWVLRFQCHNLEMEVRHSQVDREEGLAQADNLGEPEVGYVRLAEVVPLAEAYSGEVCFEEGAAEMVVVEVDVRDWTLNPRRDRGHEATLVPVDHLSYYPSLQPS